MYYRLSSLICEDEAIKIEVVLRKYFSHLSSIITIMNISDDATLSSKQFIRKVAEINEQYKNVNLRTYIVGLTGIRKLFFKTYKFLTPSDPVEIILEPNIEAVEAKLSINFDTDFTLLD